MTNGQEDDDDIAIIGMSCRVAGARSTSQLWDHLTSSKDVQSTFEPRFRTAAYYKPDGAARKGLTNVSNAYLIDEELGRFDASFFSISPVEAASMDPQQRLLLELAFEAIENSGIPLDDLRGTDTGVFTGISSIDYAASLLRDLDTLPKYTSTGISNALASNRISYAFDLCGPNFAIDTACSSSMVALHQARLSLQAKECEMALVCGANLILAPDMFVHMSELGILSPNGRCRSFDINADGYARGEGVIALMLKPLKHALRDNDAIRAVLRASGINQDGKTQGITQPSKKAQIRNMQDIYRRFHVDTGEVQYLEAHGTGTKVGDATEMSAISSVYSASHEQDALVVGSVKSNIGHLEASAALAGIVKVVESLERGLIPPQMNLTRLNPDLECRNIRVPTTTLAWPTTSDVRRAAINSFGYGGTNGHAVLESFPKEDKDSALVDRTMLFKFSAASEKSLKLALDALANYVETENPSLQHLAYTLLARRSTFNYTTFLLAKTHEDLLREMRSGKVTIQSRRQLLHPDIGFIFTGQGSQWPRMGSALIQNSPIFAQVVADCDQILQSLPDAPQWRIAEELNKAEDSRVYEPEFSQPLCTVIQLGLVRLWESLSITPQAVVGHSSGEIAAAFAAGHLSLRDAVTVAFYRGYFIRHLYAGDAQSTPGAMCAVGVGEQDCAELLDPYKGRVNIAAVNSPTSCTLSGDLADVEDIVEACQKQGVFCRKLRVDAAYHSHHMLRLSAAYEDALRKARVTYQTGSSSSRCTMYSSVYSRSISAKDVTAEYWKNNLVSTVRFSGALTLASTSQKLGALIEIGPHPALKGPAEDTLASLNVDKAIYLSSCVRGKDDFESHLETVSQLVLAGVPLDYANINAEASLNAREGPISPPSLLTDLPPYCWDHSVSHWGESRVGLKHRSKEYPRHELLGSRVNFDNDLARSWRNLLSMKELKFLKKLNDLDRHVPPSVFIMMALEAARQTIASAECFGSTLKLSQLRFPEHVLFFGSRDEKATLETYFLLRKLEEPNSYSFEISASSRISPNDWKTCCTGEISFGKTSSDGAQSDIFKTPESLSQVESVGIQTCPPLEGVRITSNKMTGQVAAWNERSDAYSFNPTLLASLFSAIETSLRDRLMHGVHLLESLEFLELPAGEWLLGDASFTAHFASCGTGQASASCQLEDANGQCMVLHGLQFAYQPDIQENIELGSLFLRPEWRPDITFSRPFDRMAMSDFLGLVSHKWPMCDIGLVNIGEANSELVVADMLKLGRRAPFRSITVVGPAKSVLNRKIRYADDIDEDLKMNLLFVKSRDLGDFSDKINQDGFVCVQAETPEQREAFCKQFDLVGQIIGLQEDSWFLGKARPFANTNDDALALKIVSTLGISSQDFGPLKNASIVPWSELHYQEDPFDLVVVDCDDQSTLLKSRGQDLLPWLRLVLDRVRTLVWVTKAALHNPFNDVSGSLLRTITNEHPAMKCASVCVQDTLEIPLVAQHIGSVYEALQDGCQEGEFRLKNGSLEILRYLPNDELSASVGVSQSVSSTYTTGEAFHEISVLASEPRLLVDYGSAPPNCGEDDVLVSVEMSLVDQFDVLALLGSPIEQHSRHDLGMFCAGIVTSKNQTEFDQNTRVVAWQSGAHRSQVVVPLVHVQRIPADMDMAQALAFYAVKITASAVLHHHARVRRGDTVCITGDGLLLSVLRNLCHELAVDVVADLDHDADFTIQYDAQTGLTVNGGQVTLKDYLRAAEADITMAESDDQILDGLSKVKVWTLSQLPAAFKAAKSAPDSTVLDHRAGQQVEGSIIKYTPDAAKFRPDGAYVILGGLGGIGRFLCQWMVRHGARHIVTLNRSGPQSKAADDTIAAVHNMGGVLEAIQADANNLEELETVLHNIRRTKPIHGCINMAMVVDDGPLATMEPDQWDRVIEAKVKTSWNLHHATMTDPLEFFIMFSSLAAVLGNRVQSNYAVGNAFQNSLARYRRAQGQPGVAVALGPMTEIGVMSNDEDLMRTYKNSGLRLLAPSDLIKLFEGALIESRLPSAPGVIGTGLEMFHCVNGRIQAEPDQSQIFWSGMPEFGHVFDHSLDANSNDQCSSVKEQLSLCSAEAGHAILLKAFLRCLSGLLGLDPASTNTSQPLSQYGLDSLNALSCRYWFFQEINVDMTIFDILGSRSIDELVSRAIDKFFNLGRSLADEEIPAPSKHSDCVLRPLSHSQKRLWFLHNVMADKTALNLLLVCHIKGQVDTTNFKAAWTLLLARHEVLRSKIIETEDGPQQIPIPDAEFNLAVIQTNDDSFEAESNALKVFLARFQFDLEAGDLVRGWLLRAPSKTAFFLASHHLAWDRQSSATAFDETTKIYRNLVSGNSYDKTLDPVPFQFVDYALWQQSCLERDALTRPHIDYWKNQLTGAPEAISLLPVATVTDRPFEKQDSTGSFSCVIPSGLSERLKTFCAAKAATPFMFMASAISIAMYRLTGDADVVLGIPDGDRGHSDFDSLIGFTVNMLPIRCRLEAHDMLFNDYLEDYRKTCLEAYEHRQLPFDMLIQELDVARHSSHNPLFQITVNYQIHGAFPKYDYGDFEMVDYDHHNAKHQTDLSLEIEEYPDGSLKCDFEFDDELYDLQGIQSFAETYVQLISSVLEVDGAQAIGEIRLLPDSHLETIASTLHPPITGDHRRARCDTFFNDLFEQAVAQQEEKEALVDTDRAISYNSLFRLTNKVVNSLQSNQIQVGTRVAVMCRPSISMVLAIYGILRAGCVYVPVDADSPVDRLRLILADVDVQHALVDNLDFKDRLIAGGIPPGNIYTVDDVTKASVDESKPSLARAVAADDGFCCIFTSGSTGRPKGIEICQRQLRLQMQGYNDAISTSSEDRILLSAAAVFDMSLPALFGTILRGATMCIASSEQRYSATEMVDFVVSQKVSSCVFTPTQLKFILTSSNRDKLEQWQSLKSMVVGGEALTTWLVHEFYKLNLGKAILYDGYGPTEATVANSIRSVLPQDADSGYIAIGGPTFPAQFYILDKNMAQVPLGFPGELYIGGPTVSRGYIKREELSKQVFVDNSFASPNEREQGYDTLYRSGDCFSLDHRGLLRFHGRVAGDRQVKIRGKRTELNEIENVTWSICQSSSISTAANVTGVAVLYHQPKGAENDMLIAYLAVDGMALRSREKSQLFSTLRESLGSKLPEHMTPSIFVFVPKLPTTISGKMDYKSIQAWDVSESVSENAILRSAISDTPQLTPLQLVMSGIWQRVLQSETLYHPQSEFFASGGHSLLLFQVQTEIKKEFGVKVPISALFGAPSLDKMTDMVQEHVNYLSDGSTLLDDSSRDSFITSPMLSGEDDYTFDAMVPSTSSSINWQKELVLPLELGSINAKARSGPASVVAITGASKMIGAYILRLLLPSQQIERIYCLAEDGPDEDAARQGVIDSLSYWKADKGIPKDTYKKLTVLCGSLKHETLGLAPNQVDMLDHEVHAIYNLAADVSLFKNYTSLRAGNVGSLRFLINLAAGHRTGKVKHVHHLSTWGVSHLQSWTSTELSESSGVLTGEEELSNMSPGPEDHLGYLKTRWACEALLYQAAEHGLPVSIYRSCLCSGSRNPGVALDRSDTNRRTIAACLAVGMVPDFGSSMGGGMSWISADFLAGAITFLADSDESQSTKRRRDQRYKNKHGAAGKAAIHNVVSDKHYRYAQLCEMLNASGRLETPLRLVEPAEWFRALRALGTQEMMMHADVLESWWEAGWVPFGLDGNDTLDVLWREAWLKAPHVDGNFLLDLVVGSE